MLKLNSILTSPLPSLPMARGIKLGHCPLAGRGAAVGFSGRINRAFPKFGEEK